MHFLCTMNVIRTPDGLFRLHDGMCGFSEIPLRGIQYATLAPSKMFKSGNRYFHASATSLWSIENRS